VAALRTLEIMEEEGLLANATAMGALLKQGLHDSLGGVTGVKEIRGQGLMLGVELNRPCAEIVSMGLEAGLLTNVTQDSVVRIVPPLIINEAETREMVSRIAGVIKRFLAQSAVVPASDVGKRAAA